ncbi:MAG: Alpha-tubulin suppressor [Marmoricola sp.]|nr:Alpha-tubulin suppressor [Marmoricola sp.]
MTLARLHPSRPQLFRTLLALVACLLVIGVLAPPSNAATRRSLSIASPSTGFVRSGLRFSGKLSRSPKGSIVVIQRFSGSTWVTARSTRTTTSTGSYSTVVTLPLKPSVYSFRAFAPARGSLKAATSRIHAVGALVRTYATIKATPATLPAAGTTTLAGTVKPFLRGASINIQRLSAGTWTQLKIVRLSSTGTFSTTTSVSATTSYRASVPPSGYDASATSAAATVTVSPTTTRPVISTTSLPSGQVGNTYTTTLTATGNPAGTWAASPLPAGVSLDPSTGVISGTPTTPATTHVVIGFTRTSNGLSAVPTTLDLVVAPASPPTISTTSLPDGVKGQAYTATLTATGNPPGSWSVDASSTDPLPAGLSLDSATGALTGTPTSAGTSQITVKFVQTSTALPVTKLLPLVVAPPPAPQILTTALPDATQFSSYTTTLVASGGATGTWSITGGSLPLGFSLSAATGTISGSTIIAGPAQVTIDFTNADGTATPVAYTLTVLSVGTPSTKAIIAAGGTSTCRVRADQTLWCWGYDDAGQLGDNGVTGDDPTKPNGQATPAQVGTAIDWTTVSVGGDALPGEGHACGLRGTDAYCWGAVASGVGSTTATGFATTPALVPGGLAFAAISAGFTNSCGVTTTGALYCWGQNTFGQLGTGGGDVTAPTRVGSDSSWTSVSSGYTNSCGIQAPGRLYCWGSNFRGQLGLGNHTDEATPTQVGPASDWTGISVGNGYTCGIRAAGTIWCWGPSTNGQLGNGSEVNSSATDELSPSQVGLATTWTSLRAGGGQTCATNTGAEIWCWGANGNGQIGDGTQTGATDNNRTTPVKVGTDTDWASVASGNQHTCAAKTSGAIWCWGSNAKGKLGIGSAAAVEVAPTAVVG